MASWTFIAEEAPSKDRAKHCGSAQIAWMLGPVVVFAASIPMNEMFGLLGNRLIFAHLIVVAAWIWYQRLRMPESILPHLSELRRMYSDDCYLHVYGRPLQSP